MLSFKNYDVANSHIRCFVSTFDAQPTSRWDSDSNLLSTRAGTWDSSAFSENPTYTHTCSKIQASWSRAPCSLLSPQVERILAFGTRGLRTLLFHFLQSSRFVLYCACVGSLPGLLYLIYQCSIFNTEVPILTSARASHLMQLSLFIYIQPLHRGS